MKVGRFKVIIPLVVIVGLSLLPVAAAEGWDAEDEAGTGMAAQYAALPVSFIENRGQADPSVLFVVATTGRGIFFTRDGFTMATSGSPGDEGSATLLRMEIVGSSPSVSVQGMERMAGMANFFLGSDPASWQTGVPMYRAIIYRNLYPGVDMTYRGSQGILKREFSLAPGVNPSVIRLRYSGMEGIAVNSFGGLEIRTSSGVLREARPVCYQEINGRTVPVGCQYGLGAGNILVFRPGPYDPLYPLIIDPELEYSTFLGGNLDETGNGIAIDDEGYAYITGYTLSTNFPVRHAINWTRRGFNDVFVTKMNQYGTDIEFSTYIGGIGDDGGMGIALDPVEGNIFFTGYTASCDYPQVNPIPNMTTSCNAIDAFLTEIDPDGTEILNSTVFGGFYSDQGRGVAVDSGGVPVVTGFTYSCDFPTTDNAYQPEMCGDCCCGVNSDAFISKIAFNGTNSSFDYSTFLGGCGDDKGSALALDESDNVYVTGYTKSFDFPVVNPFWGMLRGNKDAFVARMDNDSPEDLVFSTYLGGRADDEGLGIAVGNLTGDPEAVVTGYTMSNDFPRYPRGEFEFLPYQANIAGMKDIYVTWFTTEGDSLRFYTYLGGTKEDQAEAVAVDDTNTVYVGGFTRSTDIPLVEELEGQDTLGGGQDGYVGKLRMDNDTGEINLIFSTYLGGTDRWDAVRALAVDEAEKSIYLTGFAQSSDFPVVGYGALVEEPFQPVKASWQDAFVSKIYFDQPVADFIGTPLIGVAPLSVSFTDLSTGDPYSWNWSFGDGSFSELQEPTHVYTNGSFFGNLYNVSLTIWNSIGPDTMTKTNYITVGKLPIVNASANLTIGPAPLNVSFEDWSYGNVSLSLWNFGDGSTSTTPNTTHEYPAGTHLANLTVNNTFGGNRSANIAIIAWTNLTANFTASPLSGAAPLLVTFNDTSTGIPGPGSWAWDFGDGSSGSGKNTTHTFTTAGTYNVSLNVTNAIMSNVSANQTITVSLLPFASFVPNVTSGLAPVSVLFNDTSTGSPTSWSWNFGDGNTSATQNETHTFGAGIWNVSLNVSNSLGSNLSANQTIISGVLPVANFTAAPLSGGAPLNVTFTDTTIGIPSPHQWSWKFDDGTTSALKNPYHTFSLPGTYNVSLNATNLFGSNISANQTITVGLAESGLYFSSPSISTFPVNASKTVQVWLDQVPTGLAGYNITIAVHNATVANITPPIDPPSWRYNESAFDYALLSNSRVIITGIDFMGTIGPGDTDVPLGNLTLNGTSVGSSYLWVESVDALEDDDGNTISLTVTNSSFSVVTLLPIIGSSMPNDLDGDGLYEDINGNFIFNFNDVRDMFLNLNKINATEPHPLFNFNGVGVINFNDVIALFRMLS